MMKKVILLVLLFSVSFQLFVPIQADAITLGEYEAKLEKYKKDAYDNKTAINKTESEINSANKEINNLKNELLQLGNEIKELTNEIDDYKKKIEEKLIQSRQVLEYLQLSTGENMFIEYIFDADTTTEMIYRSAVVQELIDYNNKAVDEMKQLISDNENRQKEIDKRKLQINSKEEQLVEKIETLGEKKETLTEAGVSVSQQIKIYEELVASYKKLGCTSKDVIGVDCAVSSEAGVFRRPTKTGYITQEAYYSKSYTHRGVDIGSYNRKKEKIYPVANGKIIAKYKDYYGALVIAIEHYNSKNKTWYTSLYAHLDSYAPNLYVGKNVTTDQYIGYMGETGYSFGVHLHFELIPCRLYNWSEGKCSTWNSYVAYAQKVLKDGYKGPRALIVFPKGTYNSWNSR
ncbi:MAG: peptidoglycan DD-metalloendopeptidase family protein [Bacilli bacterium]|nr:peptidoglycan DD-metalloendopeptidase family protein [Bacilli bacterium]